MEDLWTVVRFRGADGAVYATVEHQDCAHCVLAELADFLRTPPALAAWFTSLPALYLRAVLRRGVTLRSEDLCYEGREVSVDVVLTPDAQPTVSVRAMALSVSDLKGLLCD